MSPEAMRNVEARGLFDFTIENGTATDGIGNTNLTFTRISINANVDFAGGIQDTNLGYYDDSSGYSSANYSPGCSSGGNLCGDLEISDLTLESSGGGGTASLTDPYVELAFRNFNTDASRELVGVRIGAEQISARTPFSLSEVSGYLYNDCAGVLGTGGCLLQDPGGPIGRCGFDTSCYDDVEIWGHRSDNLLETIASAVGIPTELQLNSTEDFWISMNSEDILWQHNNPALGNAPTRGSNPDPQHVGRHTDGQGFWVHAADGAKIVTP